MDHPGCADAPGRASDRGADRAVEALPGVGILVDDLGAFGAAPVLEIGDDERCRRFGTDVLAGVRLTPSASPPGTGETGAGGRVRGPHLP